MNPSTLSSYIEISRSPSLSIGRKGGRTGPETRRAERHKRGRMSEDENFLIHRGFEYQHEHHHLEGMEVMCRSKSTSSMMADCGDFQFSSPSSSLLLSSSSSSSSSSCDDMVGTAPPSGVAALLLDYGRQRERKASSSPRRMPLPTANTSSTKMIASASLPDFREFEEYKKKRARIESAVQRLSQLLIEMEYGIKYTESVWERISASNAGVVHMEVAPKSQALLCNALTRMISLENSMLNRIEDMQNCVEQEYHIFINDDNLYEHRQRQRLGRGNWCPNVPEGNQNSSISSKSLAWDYSRQRFRQCGEEIHMFLQGIILYPHMQS